MFQIIDRYIDPVRVFLTEERKIHQYYDESPKTEFYWIVVTKNHMNTYRSVRIMRMRKVQIQRNQRYTKMM